ncbi:short-chain dehydrogenase-like protein, partial [Dinothrombium tinctorium]
MFDTMGFKKEETIKVQEEFASKNPLGRVAESSDVANTILFLASNLASYLTGAIIPVDGGYTIA